MIEILLQKQIISNKLLGIIKMAKRTLLISRIIALRKPMKASKKKLKYIKILNALKLSMARIDDRLFKNTSFESIPNNKVLTIRAARAGRAFKKS